MILYDYSSLLHRKVFTAVSNVKPRKVDGQYVTSDFINVAKHFIVEELIETQLQFQRKYGELVICLDKSNNGYWRRDVLPSYKFNRKVTRDKSEINFPEVFAELNLLTEQIKTNTPWKCVEVDRAEADDTMLILAHLYNGNEPILIMSPDKDMIQAQRDGANVKQWSSLTKKWLSGTSKSEDMTSWVNEHCALGDVSDGVPKIVHGTEFSQDFKTHLLQYPEFNAVSTPWQFKQNDSNLKRTVIDAFDVYKVNTKKEITDVKNVYKDIRFGPAALNKKIKEHGSMTAWLDTNPHYRENFERNYTLVMREGIPQYMVDKIVEQYKIAPTTYNVVEFEKYLETNNLKNVLSQLSSVFKIDRELTAEDFNW